MTIYAITYVNIKEGFLLKKIALLFGIILMLFAVSACDGAPVIAPAPVDKTALISLLEDFERIPKNLDQSTLVTAYTLVRDNDGATQKEVNDAVVALKEMKETIFATPMSFIDGGVEPHVRAALGFEADKLITIGDCYALEELDCTYREELGVKIRVSYDFRYFPNLKKLDLTGNSLEDLNGLANLTSLQYLSLADNPVKVSSLSSDDSAEEMRSLAVLGTLPIAHLDLSGTSVILTTESLPAMSHLTYLDISGNQLPSLSGMNGKFPKLETLVAADCVIADVSALVSFASVKTMDFSRTAIADFSFFSALENLSTLILDGVPVSDCVSLTKIPKLTSLSLSGCGITDVAWIAGFSSLIELDLSENSIFDLTFVVGKLNVQKLDLSDNAIAAFSLTDTWSSVEELDLSRNGLVSFSVITGDGNCALRVLDLSQNAVNVFSLGNPSSLESLNLSGNVLEAFSLKSDSLRSLSLSGNPLSSLSLDVPSLATLDLACDTAFADSVFLNTPALQVLDLSGNFTCPSDLLSSLTGLETLSVNLSGVSAQSVASLTALKTLTVYGGDDAAVSAFASLPRLESLTVFHSAVTSPQLSSAACLRVLVFDSCSSLSDLTGLNGIQTLESLTIRGGSLATPVLSGLPVLRSLTLSECGVSTLLSMTDLPALESLNLSGNGIQSIEVLGFSRLQYLDLSNNKLSSPAALAIDMVSGSLDLSGNESSLYADLSAFSDSLKVITSK